jgi:hypothetical protein
MQVQPEIVAEQSPGAQGSMKDSPGVFDSGSKQEKAGQLSRGGGGSGTQGFDLRDCRLKRQSVSSTLTEVHSTQKDDCLSWQAGSKTAGLINLTGNQQQ